MLRSSSRVSFLSSVLTNEAIVTNAMRSLKADMPVGTRDPCVYPAWQPPLVPNMTSLKLILTCPHSHTHFPDFTFLPGALSFQNFRYSLCHLRPHRSPALDRAQSAPRADISSHRVSLRPALRRIRAPTTANCVPRRARSLSAAVCVGGGYVRVGEWVDVRDAQGSDVARFCWGDCGGYEYRTGGRRCAW